MSVTPCCLRKRFTSFQLNFSFAALRLIARPAPCDAELSDSGLPLPLTTKPGDAYVFATFRATFVVRCTLTTADGRALFRDRDFTASASLQPSGDVIAQERGLDGPLFADIAAQVREAATTAW